MPYKPKIIERLPQWIRLIANGDRCLDEVLTEAWVAGEKAHEAADERGDEIPRMCSGELREADGILESIQDGRVPRNQLARKAAQAVRKFSTARECAIALESDASPRFAHEPHRVRLLEDSLLARRAR